MPSSRPRWLRIVKDQPTPGQLRQMFPSLPWSSLEDAPGSRLSNGPGVPDFERTRWELRGEPRTRATFAAPHPADFPGGLPDPPEYPEDTGRP